ncbi:methyltransferase domain-containing protein [Pleurocapsales cyanobacterium LEGE 06147]|nr:methyltransferase domain-containing protein [Pleurocapsales cyanobacterium LEGE 06147]
MLYILKERASQLQELADDPDCDEKTLYNTYAHFKILNRLVSHWRSVYVFYIRPLLRKEKKTWTLLDIGCGGGDITLALAEWAKKDNLALQITAIDTDIRAINFVNNLSNPHQIKFQHASTKDLIAQNKSFDLVISNHLIHHLNSSELKEILTEAESLAQKMVIFNDIERSDFLYFSFALLALFIKPFFPNSFIWVDGLRSIKRGYSQQELRAIASNKWQVKRLFLFRILLIYSQ